MDTAQTVAKALGIIELLGKYKALSASQVIEKTELHRSTAYRLLGTLFTEGYIRKDEDSGLYSLSTKILKLASSVSENKDIKQIASPLIEELHRLSGETVHLAVLDNDQLVYLDKHESDKNLRVVMSSKEGGHAPLYCTAIGKVLLAGMQEKQLMEYLKTVRFIKYTKNTLEGPQELLKELDIIRAQLWAEDREEHEEGVYCLAAPVKNNEGKTIAAFSLSMPMLRRNPAGQEKLLSRIIEISERINAALA